MRNATTWKYSAYVFSRFDSVNTRGSNNYGDRAYSSPYEKEGASSLLYKCRGEIMSLLGIEIRGYSGSETVSLV